MFCTESLAFLYRFFTVISVIIYSVKTIKKLDRATKYTILTEKIYQVKELLAKKNAQLPILDDSNFEVGISIGFATYDREIDRTYSDVFHRADNAMYADKREFYKTHEDRRMKTK